MKKKTFILIITFGILSFAAIMNSCVSTAKITEKSGAQLWGENCIQCHNTPSPADYSDAQWETIGMHMQMRASLTNDETEKIVDFLQTAN